MPPLSSLGSEEAGTPNNPQQSASTAGPELEKFHRCDCRKRSWNVWVFNRQKSASPFFRGLRKHCCNFSDSFCTTCRSAPVNRSMVKAEKPTEAAFTSSPVFLHTFSVLPPFTIFVYNINTLHHWNVIPSYLICVDYINIFVWGCNCPFPSANVYFLF